ncbi:5-deoxy-glucuronate isomerase [Bogoriella caseilytica]|uniref:5-deoxyglucuronate isomerase n=1 Tax=Bogoriella caseilytica TaxID=56055 RepID=A0A3N2BD01_9MICO|nr:5-deoxy-glucuronate isomerase [Bogoriella caseilytica]ROR73133.1 5-deoxyglucuronate isomerase [Bogoriella caseilytica]
MTSDNDRYLVRRAPAPVRTDITPESAGWGYSGLCVVELDAGETHSWELSADEALLVPLAGGAELQVRAGRGAETEHAVLHGRRGVFEGPSDVAYLPVGSQVTVTATGPGGGPGGARLALATARAVQPHPFRIVAAAESGLELRGAGNCSRHVTNYTIGTDVAVNRLLVCEVITPGGNWSSYPPHKHDEHSETERELEEIYYFEIADSPAGAGVAYHRTYGTEDRPIDVLAEVRSGDTALVPHGYHGPCTAPPGHDLYYLNVMAGPAEEAVWMSVDDPHYHWIRGTWENQAIDPRLPAGTTEEDQ